jgi:universal stress protein E
MKRFQNILFVKSLGNDEAAMAHAVALAKHNQTGLTLVKATEQIPDVSGAGFSKETVAKIKQAVLDSYRNELEELAEPHQDTIKYDMSVLEGIPFLVITQDVLRNDRDLVIKAVDSEKGLSSRLFGSVDMRLLRKCPCPIWLVHPEQPNRIKKIVAAVDFDEPGEKVENQNLNKQIMEMSLSLAHREGAELHMVHAWCANLDENVNAPLGFLHGLSKPPEFDVERGIKEYGITRERRLAKLMDEAKAWVGEDVFDAIKPKTHAIQGRARQVVPEQTLKLDADLLVMGTVGRTGIPGFFMGNTAESILNRIDCSVLALKPEGFVSPVKLPKD